MIVAFGEAIVDLFAEPLGRAVEDADRFVPHLGGALANVAAIASRLGAPVRFVGAVGRDGHGDRIVRALDDAGVDTSRVVRVAERTAVTFVRVAGDGERSFLFYRALTADQAMPAEHLASSRPFEDATWAVTGTSAHIAEPLATSARAFAAEADARAIPRVVDLNVRAHRWPDRAVMADSVRLAVAGAAIVKASEEDLAALGLPPTLDAIRALAPAALPLLTLGARGAVAAIAGQSLAVAAPAVSAVDATGAGDAFVACILAGLHRHRWAEARSDTTLWTRLLEAACALGARAVTAPGATTAARAPWPDAVTRLLPSTPERDPTP